MRAVPGALSSDVTGRANDPKRLTSGVEGVQRLCKALISATYLAVAMEAWGEDLVRVLSLTQHYCLTLNPMYPVLPRALGRDQPQGIPSYTG